jgi:T-complex protein 1 subunit alpha
LENLATTLGSREQLAIAEFAESLLIIPKVLTYSPFRIFTFFTTLDSLLIGGMTLSCQVLSVNAAKDATELVAKLRAYHHTAQTKADKQHFSR